VDNAVSDGVMDDDIKEGEKDEMTSREGVEEGGKAGYR